MLSDKNFSSKRVEKSKSDDSAASKLVLKASDDISIEIEQVSLNSDDWVIIKDEKYRPDKEKFIEKAFIRDFPNIKLPVDGAAERVYNLAARSTVIKTWLAKNNLEYSLLENSPTYYRDSIPPREFKEAQESLIEIRKLNSQRAIEELEIVNKYKEDMENLKEKYKVMEEKFLTNNYVQILNLNSQSLPLSLQNAIENYTAAANSPDRKTYARELLIKFQVALINCANDCAAKGKEFNFNKIIESLSVK